MTKFEVVVPYGDGKLKITADTFAELHAAAARVHELDADARHLRRKHPEAEIVPDFRIVDGNEFYGWKEADGPGSVTFGTNKEKGAVPFFPKGAEGYYNRDSGSRGGEGRASEGRAPEPPRAGQRRVMRPGDEGAR